MFASFDRFELQMTLDQAKCGSHQGQCDDGVACLLTVPTIRRQLDKIGHEKIREELSHISDWSDAELDDKEACRARIVWIAAGNIVEEQFEKRRTA